MGQGVYFSGEMKVVAKATRPYRKDGSPYESVGNHWDKTRNQMIYSWAGRSLVKTRWKSATVDGNQPLG